MTVSPPAPPDAADLAAAVRQLALRTHRLLNDPTPAPSAIRELSQSAATLRRRLRGRNDGSVARWLDKLERRLTASVSLVSDPVTSDRR
jgi:hypothetical protein